MRLATLPNTKRGNLEYEDFTVAILLLAAATAEQKQNYNHAADCQNHSHVQPNDVRISFVADDDDDDAADEKKISDDKKKNPKLARLRVAASGGRQSRRHSSAN